MEKSKRQYLPLNDYQLYLYNEGTDCYSYKMFGAHYLKGTREKRVSFAVWAPNAEKVSVVGDFNRWDTNANSMVKVGGSGVWQAYIDGINEYDLYKYAITTKDGHVFLKSDPFGFYSENRPATASKVVSLDKYIWNDEKWQKEKKVTALYDKPVSIYEVHPGSWKRKDNGGFLSYREFADELVGYVKSMGYTHIELLPIMEHPLDDSWGYQVTGYYSITSRYGTPYDFMYFVDKCHQEGIGVILDWVPAHFSKDAHGLIKFDGTCLYEYDDPRKGEHSEWGTLVFDYGKGQVLSFLISNAIFYLDIYHVDGLRVDAVSSMLYLDYGRSNGEWVPNKYGGRENIEAIEFLRKLNIAVFKEFPNTLMIAEESTAWPMVSKPTYMGGLGFNYKWNMGWMHDVLEYMSKAPIDRKSYHKNITFSIMYAYSENFILPFSHDEVVHGKKSLLCKMPGEYNNKFANLRLLIGYMISHPGKKLLFMGCEFGQFIEWRFYAGLDWGLLKYEMHSKLHKYVRDLNHFYLNNPALYENDTNEEGFKWIEPNDSQNSILSFIRYGKSEGNYLVVICNFCDLPQKNYCIGVPDYGEYTIALNSDDVQYGGSGLFSFSNAAAAEKKLHGLPYSISIDIPPLSIMFLKHS